MPDHGRRSTPTDAPRLAAFSAMDMDERWVSRSPRTMLETFHWFRGEGFGFIVEDLLALPKEPNIIVEGFRLLPHLVRPLLATLAQAVWLLPTPEFRRAALEHRGGTWTIAGRTSDPERALRNLAERDRMFVHHVHREAQRLGLHAIEVDTGTTEDDLLERVAGTFGL
jgi:hypothetical protein